MGLAGSKNGPVGVMAGRAFAPESSVCARRGKLSRSRSSSKPPRSGGWQWRRITMTRRPWVMARLRQPLRAWSRQVQYTLSPAAFSRRYRNDSNTRKVPPKGVFRNSGSAGEGDVPLGGDLHSHRDTAYLCWFSQPACSSWRSSVRKAPENYPHLEPARRGNLDMLLLNWRSTWGPLGDTGQGHRKKGKGSCPGRGNQRCQEVE